ncbi:phage tail-collar fiber domain-containing protein [Providencia sp. PROV129]|uniref:phage tail-collar fiber domain-containing protein n=1 Tax=Providencia sp. PROV129 TaxID=2949839 RepID=UPI003FA6E26F
MSKPYYSILTNIGENLVAKATALGTKLDLTTMAVGDGNGKLPAPDPAQTKLINEKRRAAVNSLEIDKNNPNIIIAEHIIPETEGGWYVREIGLFDSEGNLIAVGNCPETYKPKMVEGSGRTQIIRMMIVVKSTECIELKTDPSVVLATRDYLDTQIGKNNEEIQEELKSKADNEEVKPLADFSVNALKNRNPIAQRHDFAFVASRYIREKTELAINPSTLLQSVDLTVPASPEYDLIFKVQVSGLESQYDFSQGRESEKEAFAVAGVCDGLLRENWNMRSHITSYDGNMLTITLPKAALLTGFGSAGVRLGIDAIESFEIKKFAAFQNGKRIAFIPFNKLPPKKLWSGASVLRAKSTGLGFDFGVNMQLGKESLFNGNNFMTAWPDGSRDNISAQEWGLELNLRWNEVFPQFDAQYFEGDKPHSTYRRVVALSLKKDYYLLGHNAVILGGVELIPSAWVSEGDYNGLKMYSAIYDYDANHEAAIRNGTKQPFLAALVPESKTNSVVSYALKNVVSVEAVKRTENAYYYEHSTKKMYFNWGKSNGSAYLYVCEVDNVINATSTVYAAGCKFYASKSDTVKVQPDKFSESKFAGFYQCSAGISAGGSGAFAINNIHSECIMSTARSHKNDGFNYHYSGTSLIKDCVMSHNGDDGISHHEGCIGYVVNSEMNYNYAATSVPAYGAKVWHYNCNAKPADTLSGKPYAGKYACISGQDQSSEAWYDNCYLDGREITNSVYCCISQQEGTTARIHVNSAKIESENTKLFEVIGDGASVTLSKTRNF